MHRSQSKGETSSHYWNLGGMQEDWDDMHISVWQLAVSPWNPSSSSILLGRGIPDMVVQWMSDPPLDLLSRSHLLNVDPASLVLAVRPMKMTHQASFHGWLAALLAMALDGLGCDWVTRESTSHTPGLTCSALSTDDWWSFPHSALLSHTTDSGLPHWDVRVCPDGGCQLSPWPLVTLRGILDKRTSTPWAGFLGDSWHIPICAVLSKFPGFHRSQSWVGQLIHLYSGNHASGHRNSHC